jgi:hypothetical protein
MGRWFGCTLLGCFLAEQLPEGTFPNRCGRPNRMMMPMTLR